jgi:hypothetical protein
MAKKKENKLIVLVATLADGLSEGRAKPLDIPNNSSVYLRTGTHTYRVEVTKDGQLMVFIPHTTRDATPSHELRAHRHGTVLGTVMASTWKPGAWKPRRRGAIYCSPACGAGCLHSAFREAHASAKHLLSIMRTGGWRTDVWENMGWHYALRHDELDISLHVTGEYADGHTQYFLCGPASLIGAIPHMRDPNKLVETLMKHLKSQAAWVEKSLTILRKGK